MRKFLLVVMAVAMFAGSVWGAERPRLVVNIVVGGLRADFAERYGDNFCEDGFRYFLSNGMVMQQSYYSFMQTSTPSTLATLTTGTNPSMHGVIATDWINYTTSKRVNLIDDEQAASWGCDENRYNVSNKGIVVPTLGDKLLETNPKSRVVTVATDALSAIIMGGMRSESVWWVDQSRAKWTTSNKYADHFPEWVDNYNGLRFERNYMDRPWVPLLPQESYHNSRKFVVDFAAQTPQATRKSVSRNYADLMTMPAGNYMVADFVREAVIREELGGDKYVDMLNICFDSSRNIVAKYGPESVEAEDMIYRLDRSLADLVTFIKAQCGEQNVLFVLCSDHGMSDSFDAGKTADRFNVSQFKVLVNSFMSAMFGGENWVLDYIDRQLYINRTQVYSMGLDLSQVQQQVASFVLQFRGVSHVLTSTDMQSSYFGSSHGAAMQNGFYPKRSGDLTINLMAGWIEQQNEDDERRSMSGSMYDYDRHVPLMFAGCGVKSEVVDEVVDMAAVASTLARIMGVDRPTASVELPIIKITEQFR